MNENSHHQSTPQTIFWITSSVSNAEEEPPEATTHRLQQQLLPILMYVILFTIPHVILFHAGIQTHGGKSSPSTHNWNNSTNDNELCFLSFDLGGSGLKVQLVMVEDTFSSEEGRPKKRATPLNDEVNLGRIPGNYAPSGWMQQIMSNKFGTFHWQEFALTGRGNTFKLWGGTEFDAVAALTMHDNLDIGCADTSGEVPTWAKKDIDVWCKEWIPADEVLGFVMLPAFQGSFEDGLGHFEGARARLEQIFPLPSIDNSHFVFVSWGLGTGNTILWTKEKAGSRFANKYHPRSAPPEIYSNIEISNILSAQPVDQVHQILVDIPPTIEEKHIYLELLGNGNNTGWRKLVNGSLPFWMILSGNIWWNPSIVHKDIRQIYRYFFRNQVLKSVEEGKLPKPAAMVFSGGQQEHFHIAEMLSGMLEKHGIKSVNGFTGGVHCGNVRLSYPESQVDCNFSFDRRRVQVAKRQKLGVQFELIHMNY